MKLCSEGRLEFTTHILGPKVKSNFDANCNKNIEHNLKISQLTFNNFQVIDRKNPETDQLTRFTFEKSFLYYENMAVFED